MVLVILGFWRVYNLFQSNGYLGPPFVFDIGDTFMDWFNPAYFAHNGHAYDVYKSIYLPLSFAITGLFGDPRCYDRLAADARNCDVVGIVFILLTYVACVAVTAWVFWRRDRKTAIYRSVAVAIGQPLLFALERGQLIMLTYIAFVLLYGGVLNTRWRMVGGAALMANTKVYMLLPLFGLAIKRQWRLFELCLIGFVALYLVTLLIVGEGTPLELATNLQNWFGVRIGGIWDEMLYTTTYKPLLLLDVFQYPVRDYIEQRYVDAGVIFIKGYVIFSRLLCFLCIGFAWLYPKAISNSRLVFFILMQSFIAQNPGGYAITLIIFPVFLEKGRNPLIIFAIFCAYLISFPGDWTLAKLYDIQRTSWLSQRTVMSEYVVPLGALIRPGIIALMLWSLALDSLIAFHRAMRRTPPLLGLVDRARIKRSPPVARPTFG